MYKAGHEKDLSGDTKEAATATGYERVKCKKDSPQAIDFYGDNISDQKQKTGSIFCGILKGSKKKAAVTRQNAITALGSKGKTRDEAKVVMLRCAHTATMNGTIFLVM